MNYIYDFLESEPFSSKASYGRYKEEMREASEIRVAEARTTLASLQGKKRKLEESRERIKDMLAGKEEDRVKAAYRGDFDVVEHEMAEVEASIAKAKATIEADKSSSLTYKEFLELMQKTPQILRKIKNMQERDYVCRKIFLNFTLSPEKVVDVRLKEPFKALYDLKIQNGGDGRS